MAVELSLYVDKDGNQLVSSATSKTPYQIRPLVQGDTVNLRVYIVSRGIGYEDGSSQVFNVVSNSDITGLKVGLGTPTGSGSTLVAVQTTFAKDGANTYFFATLSLNTAGITTLLGALAEKSTTLEIEAQDAGGYQTIFIGGVVVKADLMKTGSPTELPLSEYYTKLEADALFDLLSGLTAKTVNPGTTPADGFILDIAALGSAGTRDSHNVRWTGRSYDVGAINVDWKAFVDVTSNAGASTWTLQNRISAVAYATMLSITSTGILSTGDISFSDGITFITDIDAIIKGYSAGASAGNLRILRVEGGSSPSGDQDGGPLYLAGGAKTGTGINGKVFLGEGETGFFSDVEMGGLTASRAVVSDASKILISSATTLAELAQLSTGAFLKAYSITSVASASNLLTLNTTTSNFDAGITLSNIAAAKWQIRNDGVATTNNLAIYNYALSQVALYIDATSRVSIGTNAVPTAYLTLKGSAAGAASTASLKLGSGTLLVTPEAGVIEYDGVNFHGSIGATRYLLTNQNTNATRFGAAQGIITADAPTLSLTSTWNNGAVTFNGIKFNVTNTASAAASLLLDLQVGAVSLFAIDVAGKVISKASGYEANSITAPAGDPTTGARLWASAGEWQYRTSGASEGSGQTNRLHNRGELVTGVGTDYALTNAAARMDFGTTDVEKSTNSAGTFLVIALITFTAGASAGDDYRAKLHNITTAADVAASERSIKLAATEVHQMILTSVITTTAANTIQVFSWNATAARGSNTAIYTSMIIVRLS